VEWYRRSALHSAEGGGGPGEVHSSVATGIEMPKFQKFPEFALRGFDGFDAAIAYQMIPTAGARGMGIITDARPIRLRSDNPAVVRMANIRVGGSPLPTSDITPSAVALPPNSRVTFQLVGIAKGQAAIVVEGPDGSIDPSEALQVSVKDKLGKTYAIAFLRDIEHNTARTHDNAKRLMKLVETVYIQQANVELVFVPPESDVTVVSRKLGKKVQINDTKVLNDIMAVTPSSAFSRDIIIYCVWDSRDTRLITGATLFNRFCFVNDDPSDNESARTFAHEVGHALGLNHNGSENFLMSGNGIIRSSRLARFEIDTVNPSGTNP
jgi:hypothetical protein